MKLFRKADETVEDQQTRTVTFKGLMTLIFFPVIIPAYLIWALFFQSGTYFGPPYGPSQERWRRQDSWDRQGNLIDSMRRW